MRFLRSAFQFAAIICSGILLSLNSSKVRADITIDSFQDSQGPFIAGYGDGSGALAAPYPHVLGGRELILTATTVGPAGGAQVFVYINPTNDPDVLEYQSISASFGGELILMYGNQTTNNPLVTSLNLSLDSSADLLQMDFASYNYADGQDMDIIATVSADDGYSVTIPAMLTSAGAQSLDIPLTSFSESTIDDVTFDFTAPPGTNFDLSSIEFVTPVPEPAIAGALILVLIRRQKLTI